jgi:hypothetical protein
MTESIQSETTVDILQKRPYGIVCWSCKGPIRVGFALLRSDAQVEDLRNEVEAKRGLGDFWVCGNIVSGRECAAANHVTRDEILFLEADTWVLEPLAEDLTLE